MTFPVPSAIPGVAGTATVIFVDQIKKQRASDGLQAEKYRRYQFFNVEISQPDKEGADIALVGGANPYGGPVPALGELYGGDAYGGQGLIVVARSATPKGTGGVTFEVEIEYGIDISVQNTSQVLPWTRTSIIRWKTVKKMFPLEYDFAYYNAFSGFPQASGSPFAAGNTITGQFIGNTAGDPLVPTLEAERHNLIIHIHRYQLTSVYDPMEASNLEGTINSSDFTVSYSDTSLTVPAYQALLHDTNAEEAIWSNGSHYWVIDQYIEVQQQIPLAYVQVANVGYKCLTTANTYSTKVPIVSVQGGTPPIQPLPSTSTALIQPISSPVYLNPNGTLYTPPANVPPKELTSAQQPQPLTFYPYPSADWTDLFL